MNIAGALGRQMNKSNLFKTYTVFIFIYETYVERTDLKKRITHVSKLLHNFIHC